MPELVVWVALVVLGVAVGAYGTIIGAGGGFVLVPILLVLYPDEPPELITSISIAVVFCNALSGTFAYVRQKRVDFLGANSFAIATIPGAVAGSLLTGVVPRGPFDVFFAALLLALAGLLIRRPRPRIAARAHRRGEVSRLVTDSHGDSYLFSYSLPLGTGLSLLIGFLAGMLGIGGGPVHVPILIQVLRFPAQVATATSQYALMITAGTSSLVHFLRGDYSGGLDRTFALAVGVVIGAQLGARLSQRLRGSVIVELMAVALVALGVRLLLTPIL